MNISVSQRLLKWYDPDLRDLPWKSSRDPYAIWLSEIILQQTRVQQGRPYYLKFIHKYPDVGKLAAAGIDEILKLWEGLGYYSRARNLHAAAQQIVNEFDGEFPADYRSLLQLKGVGSYTAAAIASFAYGEPVAVLDGNVFRVLSRIFGESTPIDTTAGKKLFTALANEILDRDDPGKHNQAIMDFGATHCVPLKPLCPTCPFIDDCIARDQDLTAHLPVKSKKLKKTKRYFDFYVITDGERVAIEKRSTNDIWKGLYQFPLVELKTTQPRAENGTGWAEDLLANAVSIEEKGRFRQTLSHRIIEARFKEMVFRDLDPDKLPENWKLVPVTEIHEYAYPRIIRTYLQELPSWLTNINVS